MKLFWVEFRQPEISDKVLGCYVLATNSLKVALFWPYGELVQHDEVRVRKPIEEYNAITL